MRLFFAIFLNVSRGSPFIFFYFANEWKTPFLHFLALCDLPETKKMEKNFEKFGFFSQFFPHAGTVEENTWHFEVLLLFLILRYGADLGRSSLVSLYHYALIIFNTILSDKMSKAATPMRIKEQLAVSNYLNVTRVLHSSLWNFNLQIMRENSCTGPQVPHRKPLQNRPP